MNDSDIKEVRDFWDRVADDWELQGGDEGDSNRRLNSDPVLWKLAGEVRGMRVLDVGCGTGYLSRQLNDSGAHVTGVDLSARMIDIARRKHPDITFHVDSSGMVTMTSYPQVVRKNHFSWNKLSPASVSDV